MKRKITITLFIYFGSIASLIAQSLNVGFLFSPGVTFSTDYLMPSAINDSTDFQLTRYNFQVSQPLKTKIGIKGLSLKDFSFKKLDAKASQLFLNYGFTVVQPNVDENGNFETIYKPKIGFTAITASIRKGIWIYSANIYAEESAESIGKDFTPNARGYILNVKTKNLKTFYFYGGGLAVHQGRVIPFPILGLRSRLSKKIKTEIILPVQIAFNYEFNKKVNIDLMAQFSGLNSIYRNGSGYSDNHQTVNYRQLKTFLSLNAKLGKHYKVRIEGGYSSLQHLYSWTAKTSQQIESAPYVGISLNYNFGKSVFGNFMNRAE